MPEYATEENSKHRPLTYMVWHLAQAIDTGQFDAISVNDALERIHAGNLLQWLKHLSPDLFSWLADGEWPGSKFRSDYVNALQALLDDDAAPGQRIHNRGLCMLLAMTNALLQNGTNWQPQEWGRRTPRIV